jgi:uncharacterized membrane protein HdeD (DUF308 family)
MLLPRVIDVVFCKVLRACKFPGCFVVRGCITLFLACCGCHLGPFVSTVCFTHVPGVFCAASGCVSLGSLFHAFSRGVSRQRGCNTHFSGVFLCSWGVSRIFPGCFAPAGCFTHFPGVFLASGGVSRIFPGCFAPAGCFTHFPGVFRTGGVFHAFFRGVSCQRVCF